MKNSIKETNNKDERELNRKMRTTSFIELPTGAIVPRKDSGTANTRKGRADISSGDMGHLTTSFENKEKADDKMKQQDITEGKADYEQDGQNGSRIGSAAVNSAVLPSEFSVASNSEIVFTSETGVRRGNHTAESIFPLENENNNLEDQMRKEEIIAELKSVIQERSKLPKYRVGEPEDLYAQRSELESKIDALLDMLADEYGVSGLDLEQQKSPNLPAFLTKNDLDNKHAAQATLDQESGDSKLDIDTDLGVRIEKK